MTTPSTKEPAGSRLPSLEDIAALAAAYFPEFADGERTEAGQAAGYTEQAAAQGPNRALTEADYLRVLDESLVTGAVPDEGEGSAVGSTAAATVEYAAGNAGSIPGTAEAAIAGTEPAAFAQRCCLKIIPSLKPVLRVSLHGPQGYCRRLHKRREKVSMWGPGRYRRYGRIFPYYRKR